MTTPTTVRAIHGLIAAAVLATLTGLGGCASTESARRELDEVVFMYHRDLRWQRCAQAAARLGSELRIPFAERCTELEGRLTIEGLDVIAVDVEEGGEAATISVRYTFVMTPSVTLERQVVRERWIKEDGAWRLVNGAWPLKSEPAAAAP